VESAGSSLRPRLRSYLFYGKFAGSSDAAIRKTGYGGILTIAAHTSETEAASKRLRGRKINVPTVHLDSHVVCQHDIAARGLSGGVREGSSIGPVHYSAAILAGASSNLPSKPSDGKEINSHA